MAVPYTFGTATAAIPLSNLDSNFATPITLGNTAIQLGNTVTTLNNMTLANATVSSLSTAITVAQGGTGLTSTPANGALDIGNGTGFTRTTLTAGSGISITNGAGSISIASSVGGITIGTSAATTSGAAVGFTGIPSTVKRITLLFNVVSTTGTNNLLVQIGSGSYTTTGYVSTAFYATTGPNTQSVTNGFLVRVDNASNNIAGAMVLTSFGSNLWVETWMGGGTSNNQVYSGGGLVTLSGVLDRIQLITTGGDSFDAGSINIVYE